MQQRRDLAFISSDPKDRFWLERLEIHLMPLLRRISLSCWSASQAPAGSDVEELTKAALARSSVLILLASADYLASTELERISAASRLHGAALLWLPVRPSAYTETILAHIKPLLDPTRPLELLTPAEAENELVKVSKRIVDTMQMTRNSCHEETVQADDAGAEIQKQAISTVTKISTIYDASLSRPASIGLSSCDETGSTIYTISIKEGTKTTEHITRKRIIDIGRSQDNDIVLDNKRISKKHARIELIQGQIFLDDLGSANGIYVNKQKITNKFQLVMGDIIQIAHYTIQIQIGNASTIRDEEIQLEDQLTMIPSSASVRKLLGVILITDADLEAFCLDYFPGIKRKFTSSMERTTKINLLLELAHRTDLIGKLRIQDPEVFVKNSHLIIYESAKHEET